MMITIVKTIAYEVCVEVEDMDEAVAMADDINFVEEGTMYEDFEFHEE